MNKSIPKTAPKYKLFILSISILVLILAALLFYLIQGESSRTGVVIETIYTPDAIVIGSKSSKKYYFPWCYGARRLKPDNKEVFLSKDEAKRAGYEAGKQCKGNE